MVKNLTSSTSVTLLCSRKVSHERVILGQTLSGFFEKTLLIFTDIYVIPLLCSIEKPFLVSYLIIS